MKHALEAPSLHERRIDITLGCAEEQPYGEEKGAERALHFEVASDEDIEGRIRVRNFGGNVYLVRLRLADGDGLRWRLCLPELDASHDALRKHTSDFSRRVLLELERIYGKRVMQRR